MRRSGARGVRQERREALEGSLNVQLGNDMHGMKMRDRSPITLDSAFIGIFSLSDEFP